MGIIVVPGTKKVAKRPKKYRTKDAWLYHSSMNAVTEACKELRGIAYADVENVYLPSLASFFGWKDKSLDETKVFDEFLWCNTDDLSSADLLAVIHEYTSMSNSVFQSCESSSAILKRLLEIVGSNGCPIRRFLAAWCACVILFRTRHRNEIYRALRVSMQAISTYSPGFVESWFGNEMPILKLEHVVLPESLFHQYPADATAPILTATSSEDVTLIREKNASSSKMKAQFCAKLPFSLVFAWLSFEYHCLWRKKPSVDIVEECARIIWRGTNFPPKHRRWAAIASIYVLNQCCDFMLHPDFDDIKARSDILVLSDGVLHTNLLGDCCNPRKPSSTPLDYESSDIDTEMQIALLMLLQSVLRGGRKMKCLPTITKIMDQGLKSSPASPTVTNLMIEAVKCFECIVKSVHGKMEADETISQYLNPMLPYLYRCLSLPHNETEHIGALQICVRRAVMSILGDGEELSDSNDDFVKRYFALVLHSIPSLIRLHHLVDRIYDDTENESLRQKECRVLNLKKVAFTSVGAFSQGIQEIAYLCSRDAGLMSSQWTTTSFNACALMQHFANLLFHVRPSNAQMMCVFEQLINVTKDNFDIWQFVAQVNIKFNGTMLIRRSNAWLACLKCGLSASSTQDALQEMPMFDVYTLSNCIVDALVRPWRHGRIPDQDWLERRAFICDENLLSQYDAIFAEDVDGTLLPRRTRVLSFIMAWSAHVTQKVGLALSSTSSSFKSLIWGNFEPFSKV